MFCKIVVKKFLKIHKKIPVLESLFNKIADLRPATLLEKAPARVLSYEFSEILKVTFLQNTVGRLLIQK